MRSITAVGFDLDYTLASYKPSSFEALAHDATVEKLVTFFNYPDSLYDLTFDWRYMARGLVIDKKRGNILKIDRHKYVKIAHHGFSPLSREERMETYNNSGKRHEFDEPEYAMIDTLFSLAEAHLFMQLVELYDTAPHTLPPNKTYADLYRDVRGAVDLCHRDGSIKREVARNPAKYIYADPGLVPVLDMLRQSGKKMFLATNSLWDYTTVVMNWLIGGKVGPGERDDKWLEYFDVVFCGCRKPLFFTDRKDLFEVHPRTGMLWNTEGGSPMLPIGEEDLPSPELASTAPTITGNGNGNGSMNGSAMHAGNNISTTDTNARAARVFQGGSYYDLHKMLGVASGAEVLYVGDHVYSDLLRGKKGANWRTMLVIPELESELETMQTCGTNMTELRMLRQQRDALDDQIQRLEWRLRLNSSTSSGGEEEEGNVEEDGKQLAQLLENLRGQRDTLKARHCSLLQAHHEAFHPVWGQLFKTGYQNSRYAHQVERFACIYASHVSNMMFYSPLKSYRGRVDSMAHEDGPGVFGGGGLGGGGTDNGVLEHP